MFAASTVFAQDKITVLMYHQTTNEVPPGPTVVSIDRFTEHMQLINDEKYTTATVAELSDHLQGLIKLPPKTVVITFDDGWKSNLRAAELLEKSNMSATFFVMSTPELGNAYMTRDEVVKLSQNRKFEIGGHSHTHYTEYEKTGIIDARIMAGELLMSKIIIEDTIGKPIKSYAWPYGVYTPDLLRYAELIGFTSTSLVTRTSDNIYNSKSRDIMRINIDGRCTAAQLKEIIETNKLLECS